MVSEWVEGKVISKLINTPLLSVMEAKKEDFEMGWGQCLAELIACQKINDSDSFIGHSARYVVVGHPNFNAGRYLQRPISNHNRSR